MHAYHISVMYKAGATGKAGGGVAVLSTSHYCDVRGQRGVEADRLQGGSAVHNTLCLVTSHLYETESVMYEARTTGQALNDT